MQSIYALVISPLADISKAKGEGRVVRVEMIDQNSGIYTTKLQRGETSYKFRIANSRVYARGTSRKL